MLTFGPPSLASIARATLVKYKDFLEDVGWVPGDLILDVLGALSPAQLAHVEDCTLEGSGRELAPVTWPCWLQHLTFTFGAPQPGTPLPPLPVTMEEPLAPPEPGVPAANYRALYEQRQLELEKRREVSGKRLRQLWEQEASERQAKQIQVIDPLARKRPRAAASAGSSPSSSWRGGSHSASQPAGARDRLLKKLGLGGKRGGSGGMHAMAPMRQPSQAGSLRPGQRSVVQQRSQQGQQQQQQSGVRGLHSSSSAGVQRAGVVAGGAHAAPFAVRTGPAAQRSHTAPAAVPPSMPPQQQQQQQQQQQPRSPLQHRGTWPQQPPAIQQPQPRQAAPPTMPMKQQPRPPAQQQQQQQQPVARSVAPAPVQQYRQPQRQLQQQQQVYDSGQQSTQSPMAEDPAELFFLDEPMWLPPAAAPPHRPQPQQASSRQGGRQQAAGGAQPARQQQSQRQAAPQAASQATHPPNCGDLLDDVTWLPPAAAKPQPSVRSLPGSPPAATKQQQQVASRSPQGSRGAAGRPGSGAAGGGKAHWGPLQAQGPGKAGGAGMVAGKKPELHLPAPRPRTLSAVKKAAQFGAV